MYNEEINNYGIEVKGDNVKLGVWLTIKYWIKRVFKIKEQPPKKWSLHWIFKPNDMSFTGDFGCSYYGVSAGYDGTRFYLNNNGDISYEEEEQLIDSDYLIAIKKQKNGFVSLYHRPIKFAEESNE